MGFNKLFRNVHTGSKQGQGQGPRPIVSYFACSITITASGPGPVQCESYPENDSTIEIPQRTQFF